MCIRDSKNTGLGKDNRSPMMNYGTADVKKLSFLSLSLALIAGPSGLPHVLMRFYTVPTAKELSLIHISPVSDERARIVVESANRR